MQSPVLRKHAGITNDQVFMKSVTLGWTDRDFPASAVIAERKTVAKPTGFVSFGEPLTDG